MKHIDLSQQTAATYRSLRLSLAFLALGFPIVLAVGGYLRAGLPLAASMSEYYHLFDGSSSEFGKGVMRDVFVGILFAEAALLFAYKGYTQFEDTALNIASVMAMGVALAPMAWPVLPNAAPFSFSAHGIFAALFFVSLAYVCIWRARDTLHLIHDEKIRKRYQKIYKFLGGAMIILPLIVWMLVSYLPFKNSAVFFVEVTSIYVFATYWLVKSHEASTTNLDKKAAAGQLQVPPHQLTDMFSPLPVTQQAPDVVA